MKQHIAPYLSIVLLAACSSGNVKNIESDIRQIETDNVLQKQAGLGLSIIHPQSEVADLTQDIRHVLNPDNSIQNIKGFSNTQTKKHADSKSTNTNIHAATEKKISKKYAAWKKYCYGNDMTAEEWRIIDTTTMPKSLQEKWHDECIPLK